MLDRMTDAIDFHGKALQLRAQRQEVLSANIANADTPGFKARDFDFSSALQLVTATIAASSASARAPAASAAVVNPAATANAVGPPATTVGLARPRPGHLSPGESAAAISGSGVAHATRLQYTAPQQPSLDGNTVDLNRERANFADNALRYEATLRFINGRVRTMLTAIRGE